MRLTTGVVIGLILLSATAHGQTPVPVPPPGTPQKPGLVLRFDVDLVQMDAVVTDRHGKHVSDLKPEDFVVVQDGVTRELRHLEYVPAGTAAPAPPAGVLAASPKLQQDQVGRTIVLLIDDANMEIGDFLWAQRAILRFLDHSLKPGDVVSLLRTSGGSGAMQQFSSDREFLRLAVRRMVWRPVSTKFAESVLGGMMRAMRALIAFPGRKSVIWVGPGTHYRPDPEVPRRIADFANRASVTIDSIHSTPLPDAVTRPSPAHPSDAFPQSLPRPGDSPMNPGTVLADQGYYSMETLMIELADMTGGAFQPYTNALDRQITEAVNDSDGYYLVGWYPGADAFPDSPNPDAYHHVRIEVKRKGLKVRTRSGYYAWAGTMGPPMKYESEARAQDELFSPFQTGEIGVRLAASVEPSDRGGASLRSLLHIAPEGIEFHPDAAMPDCATADLEYLVSPVHLDWNDDRPPEIQWRQYAARFCGEGLRAAQKDGIAAVVVTPVARPGAYQLRVAVRNLSPGWQPHPPSQDVSVLTNRVSPIHIPVGSASESLEIPDLSKMPLAIAALTLRNVTAPPDQPGEVLVRVATGGDPAVRRFHAGDSLKYEFRLIQRDVASDVKVEILRDGKTVYTGDLPDVTPGAPFSGDYKLDASFAPGQYLLGIVARKRGAKDSVAQWIDFEVAK